MQKTKLEDLNLIVKMQFGSHVYGTNVETSDTDYKAIYLPTAEEILLGTAKDTIHFDTNTSGGKNTAEDIDIEVISLQKFLKLVAQGQTVAIDMLFTPREYWEVSTKFWDIIVANKDKLLHSQAASFVGYCRTQANKYGIKGSRMGTVETAMKTIHSIYSSHNRLSENWDELVEALKDVEHIEFIELLLNKNEQTKIPGIEICGRKFAQTEKADRTYNALEKIYDNYGHRAKKAKENQGIDWKALMHAVRICEQAKELFNTGSVTFPRPEAPLLLQIRKGLLPYSCVSEIIERGMKELDTIIETQTMLPPEPDHHFIKEFTKLLHKEVVLKEDDERLIG